MHDPMTVAWEIRSPFYEFKPWPKHARKDPHPFALQKAWEAMTPSEQAVRSRHWENGHRHALITIWHVDPQIGGSDDSCGFSYVRLTKKQIEILRNTAWCEGQTPHFLICPSKKWTGTISDAESLYRGLYLLVCRVLHLNCSYVGACRYATEKVHLPDSLNFGSEFCYLPGYHTNSKLDSTENRKAVFHSVLCGCARTILTELRPWYKHPRYHIHHFKIQWHWGQKLHRFLFARCAKCGKRFSKWGDTDVIGDWEGTRQWHAACEDEVTKIQEITHT